MHVAKLAQNERRNGTNKHNACKVKSNSAVATDLRKAGNYRNMAQSDGYRKSKFVANLLSMVFNLVVFQTMMNNLS